MIKYLFVVLSFMFVAMSSFAQSTNTKEHKTIELEGLLLDCKWGARLYKDDGINSKIILAVMEHVSDVALEELEGKKVKISGYFQHKEKKKEKIGYPVQNGPEETFVVTKFLKVSESQYERDMMRLKNICGKVKFKSLEFDESQISPLLSILNQKYTSPVIRVKMSVAEQESISITMVLHDIYAFDVIRYIARAGDLNITFDNNMIVLTMRHKTANKKFTHY